MSATTPEPGHSAKHEKPVHFIEQMIEQDGVSGRWGVWTQGEARAGKAVVPGSSRVHTRFPPEPNGYLHVGHAKSICLNFGLARRHGGLFNLRFDDTNPCKEEVEYVESIQRDVRWLGADWEGPHGGGIYWASGYFETMYAYAEELVRKGRAYVCELSAEEVARRRGTPATPGTSPFRDRPVEESLRLLREMRDGRHPDGSMTLRAKIDMGSPNFNLRDPVLYRVLHEAHHHTGKAWCIYPMYDWAHGIEDSLEGITHSICTLEFEAHRPLYDWLIDAINEGRTGDGSGPWGRTVHHAQQVEFAKLRPTYTMLSKRNLLKLVQDKVVSGWDDPRMPTLAGIRRRGFTPEAIRAFCDDIGVTKFESWIDVTRLENAVREHLNAAAPRAMCVLRPLRVTIENWPAGHVEWLDFVVNPEALERGHAGATRKIPFSGTLYIERDDFLEDPPKKFFRLSPGAEVRLRWAYFVRCVGVEKDSAGNVTGVRCTYDPATKGGDAPDGRKVKATLHWVSAEHALDGEIRLFDRLFKAERPGEATGNAFDDLNPDSLHVVKAKLDPHLASARTDPSAGEGDRYQFERLGYFALDPDSGVAFGGTGRAGAHGVWNRVVTLRDTWAKESGRSS